ncbi:MAG: HAD family hydrolase [Atopobiaceae bacterium]
MIKLALSDMDNTLIPVGSAHVSLRTLVAIHAVQAAGIEFGPATGRDRVELLPFFLGNDDYYRTGILSNGKKVYARGELVRLHLMERDAIEAVIDVVRQYPGCFVGMYPFDTESDNPAYCLGDLTHAMEFAERLRFRAIPATKVPSRRIIGVTIACPLEQQQIDQLKARVIAEVPQVDVVQSQKHWCDVLPRGVNKASGLRELEEALGISSDEVVFFGDAENDLAIMDAVPNSVAVANATPAAKAAARWHIGACADDGVAQALEQLAQGAQTNTTPAFMVAADH